MTEYAKRISELRKATGKSQEEMASLIGVSDMSMFDLEAHDDDIIKAAYPLKTIQVLANALGVSVYDLLKEDDSQFSSIKPISYSDLVELVKRDMANLGLSIGQYEDKIEWLMEAFFQGEDSFLDNYTIGFLRDLGEQLKLNWLRLLPVKKMAA